ncbi:ester cyclase [Paradevosia shaoguanensis]|uniref:ester cyclase n=1 Tax=Paradevosia shaoguanensis TaxID=1335043 RepID=UPI00068FA057|nr:nuclear transport factor 2 family protein [Paradevosia shaoguanensis]
MTIENNQATVKAYVAAMNAGDFEALRRLFAADARIEGVTGSASVDEAVIVWRALHGSLNMNLKIEAMACENDTIVVRFLESGRWTAPFLGMTEPTGKSFELVAIEWFELTDGLIHRRWGVRDAASQARQVGFPHAVGPAKPAVGIKVVA